MANRQTVEVAFGDKGDLAIVGQGGIHRVTGHVGNVKLVAIGVIIIGQQDRIAHLEHAVFVRAQRVRAQDRSIVPSIKVKRVVVEHHFLDVQQIIRAGQGSGDDHAGIIMRMAIALVVQGTEAGLQNGDFVIRDRARQDHRVKTLLTIDQIVVLAARNGLIARTAANF